MRSDAGGSRVVGRGPSWIGGDGHGDQVGLVLEAAVDGGPGHTGLAGDALHRHPGVSELRQLAQGGLGDGQGRPLVARPPRGRGAGPGGSPDHVHRATTRRLRRRLGGGVARHEVAVADQGVGADRTDGRHHDTDDHEVVEGGGERRPGRRRAARCAPARTGCGGGLADPTTGDGLLRAGRPGPGPPGRSGWPRAR